MVSGWLLLQAADVLFPAWDIPDSGIRYVLYALVLGLPVALAFAWFYDLGPEGLRRAGAAVDGDIQPLRGRDFLLLAALLAVLGAIGYGTLKDVERDVGRDVASGEPRVAEEADGAETGPPVVAVLPFTAAGGDEDSLLFADGVQHDLMTQLSRLGSLRVISRSSVMGYRDEPRDLGQIGKALGATVILEGVVRVAGEQIRINAQLIDPRSEENLWSETFDRSLTTANLFDVQADIARAISTALDAELSQDEERELSVVPTSNMAAYRVFKRSASGFGSIGSPEFIADMERAVELDPEFVQAWAELAGAYAFISRRPDGDREETLRRAEAALERIEQLAPDSVEHLYAQSYYLYYALQEYEAALALVDRAIERDPSGLRLLQLKSWIERRLGRFDQRLETMQRLITLDPLTEVRSDSLAYQLFQMHRYDDAWAQLKAPSPERLARSRNQMRWIAALLRNRYVEDFETFLRNLKSDLGIDDLVASSTLRTQVRNWQLAYAGRDYDLALRIIDNMEPYPGWENVPVSGEATLSIPVLWAMGDSLRLQAVVTETQERFERIASDQPEVAEDPIYLQDIALLAFGRGDWDEAEALLQRWEVVSLADWNHRMQFREAVCGTWGMMARQVEAVACLRRGFDEPSQMVPWMAPFQPEYDPIRDTPEFQALLSELDTRFGPGNRPQAQAQAQSSPSPSPSSSPSSSR